MRKLLDKISAKFSTKKALAAEKIEDAMVTPMQGATAMEYVLIVSIMAGVILIAWKTFLGPAIKNRMNGVSSEINNGGN